MPLRGQHRQHNQLPARAEDLGRADTEDDRSMDGEESENTDDRDFVANDSGEPGF